LQSPLVFTCFEGFAHLLLPLVFEADRRCCKRFGDAADRAGLEALPGPAVAVKDLVDAAVAERHEDQARPEVAVVVRIDVPDEGAASPVAGVEQRYLAAFEQ